MFVGSTQETMASPTATRAREEAQDLPESLARRLAADHPRPDPRSAFAPRTELRSASHAAATRYTAQAAVLVLI